MAINQFTPNPSPLDRLGSLIGAINTYYGIKGSIQKSEQEKTAFDQSQAALKEKMDPNSPQSQVERTQNVAILKGASDKGWLPKEQASAIMEAIQGKPAQELAGPLRPGEERGMTAAVPPMSSAQIESTLKESGPLMSFIKNRMTSDVADKRMDAMVAALAQRTKMQEGRLDETRNKNASQAGASFEMDPIIKTSKNSLVSLAKSQSILENPNKPVTAKDLNLAYTDYINSVAQGGAATEGKIHRELPENWEVMFNDLKAKAGQFGDLRKTKSGAQLIGMLQQNIATVREDMRNAVADQAYNIFQNYGSNTNPKVQETVRSKLKAYAPNKHAELFGGQAGQPTFSSTLGGEDHKGGGGVPGVGSAQAAGPKNVGPHGATVYQDGHTYVWNPKTGQYE